MNRTELAAQNWLRKFFGLKDGEIEYRPDIPEFRTKGDRLWGVKYLFKGAVVFYPGEWEKLAADADRTTLLVFEPKSTQPIRQWPVRSLVQELNGSAGSDVVPHRDGVKFVFRSYHDGSESPGLIAIPISRRNRHSKYFRANYIPLESLVVWTAGNYELVRSAGGMGGTQFFLVLRPVMA